jgi:ribulose 1,5-bisphosphate synthetase/thiazole synthase
MSKQWKITRRGFLQTSTIAAGAAAMPSGPTSFAQTPAGRTASSYPVLDTVDILVVGGGPAGIGAALGGARTGARTLLIENHSFFGGVASWALGMEINQIRPGGKPRSVIHELLVDKLLFIDWEHDIVAVVRWISGANGFITRLLDAIEK